MNDADSPTDQDRMETIVVCFRAIDELNRDSALMTYAHLMHLGELLVSAKKHNVPSEFLNYVRKHLDSLSKYIDSDEMFPEGFNVVTKQ